MPNYAMQSDTNDHSECYYVTESHMQQTVQMISECIIQPCLRLEGNSMLWHLRSILKFIILNVKFFMRLPPCLDIKVAVSAFFISGLLFGWLHTWSSGDPQPLLLVVPPISPIATWVFDRTGAARIMYITHSPQRHGGRVVNVLVVYRATM